MSETALSTIAEINPGVRIPKEITGSDDVSFITMSDVSESGDWTAHQTRPLRSVTSGFTAFEEGDVLVAKITPCLENGKGAHARGLRNGIGFGSTEFHVLRARQGIEPRFVFHITQSRRFRQAAARQMVGSAGQQRVQRQFFDEFLIGNFSQGEQRAIAQTLDTLDTAIRETEALIDKLKAVKQGLLHDLLTRGIDANGQLRPPQSEAPQLYKESLLGWIPKEWDAESLSKVIDLTSGQHIPTELCNSVGKGVPYFTGPSDFLGAGTVVTQYTTCPQVMCDEGDILITVKGSGCGKVAVAGVQACISRQLMSIKVPAQSLQYWLAVFQRLQERFNRLATGGNIPGISRAQILDLVVATPARIEEAAEIGGRIQTINERLAAEECGLEKLRLKKNGLIDDLFTGRVRVTPLLESMQQAAAQTEA